MTEQWYEVWENILNLARHLVDQGQITTPDAVLQIFEKPWHWESEWKAFAALSTCNICNSKFTPEEAGQEQCSIQCFEEQEARNEANRECAEEEAIRKQLAEEEQNKHPEYCGCTECS